MRKTTVSKDSNKLNGEMLLKSQRDGLDSSMTVVEKADMTIHCNRFDIKIASILAT